MNSVQHIYLPSNNVTPLLGT